MAKTSNSKKSKTKSNKSKKQTTESKVILKSIDEKIMERLDASMQGRTIQSTSTVQNMFMTTMDGVEGIPYQFMSSVDRRLTDTAIGRKYAEKIISRIPLLFLVPCKPVFMQDLKNNDKNVVASMLAGDITDASSLIKGTGKYYSVQYDYDEYYRYLDVMLASVAVFLGIADEQIALGGQSKRKPIKNITWSADTSDSFKTYFSSSENLVFYMDGMDSISESFSNSTAESSIASALNGYSDTANELKFLFGEKGSVFSSLLSNATSAISTATSSLSKLAGNIGGSVVQSLAKDGINTIVNGGKIMFPQIWSDSSHDTSYSITLKLRSPDNDSLSIFLNVIKPYCKILTLTLPRLMEGDKTNGLDSNGYKSPFLVKAYSKGLFGVDMGMITSLSVTKGAQCCWNDDGLPTQIDINLDITDLYSGLAMSGFTGKKDIKNIVNNTSYMDYLSLMAGLNLNQMEIGRRISMAYFLLQTKGATDLPRVFTKFDQHISSLMSKLYNIL